MSSFFKINLEIFITRVNLLPQQQEDTQTCFKTGLSLGFIRNNLSIGSFQLISTPES